ncbi:MAG: D-aminoacylase [Firmicutes bacterium]|nr:D-aminoacylase [Bacillota bacterium]
MDCIIKGGIIVDGTGRPPYRADIVIEDGFIVNIGQLRPEDMSPGAKHVIEVDSLCVAPGFIDIHTHSDLARIREPLAAEKITQGVTTEIVGNCGFSVIWSRHFDGLPVNNQRLVREISAPILGDCGFDWETWSITDYFRILEEQGISLNIGTLVGHNCLRAAAMGMTNRDPSPLELQAMKDALNEMLDQGALGLSTGLLYSPGSYAPFSELVELAREVGKQGRVYATHIRSESDKVIESVQEAIDVAREAGAYLHISHHKASGRKNWGKSKTTLAMMNDARESGLRVTCDAYPYVAGNTALVSFLPQWAAEGGFEALRKRLQDPADRERIKENIRNGLPGWDNVFGAVGLENLVINFVESPRSKWMEGRDLASLAAECGKPALDYLMDIIVEEGSATTVIVYQACEDDLSAIIASPYTAIGSDSLYTSGKPHPRVYGTFPRVISQFVREKKILSLEEAVRRMTSLPASIMGLDGIGEVAVGKRADLVIFDPDEIRDTAGYAEPRQFAKGISHVLVSGVLTYSHGEHTGARAGRILRRRREGPQKATQRQCLRSRLIPRG